MEKFLASAIPVYVMAAITVLGILGTMATGIYYRQMIKQTENMMNVHQAFLQQIKNRFENTYRINKGIMDIPLFIEKQMSESRFLWMHAEHAGKLSLYGALLCLIWGGNITLLRHSGGLGSSQSIFLLGCTLVCTITGITFYVIVDVKGLHEQLKLQVQEYFTNTLSKRILRAKEDEDTLAKNDVKKSKSRSGEISFSDLTKGKEGKFGADRGAKTEKVQEVSADTEEDRRFTKEDIQYLKQSLERIAAGRDRSMEKERVHHFSAKEGKIVDDILKDYFE